MSAAYDTVLAALDAAGARTHTNGDRTRAQCPAHRSRSLTLAVTDQDGRVLVHCHAGCDTGSVLAALGLTARDLFDGPPNPRPVPSARPAAPPVLTPWDEAMLDLSRRHQLGWRGPGDYPPLEHVLNRIMQEQARRAAEDGGAA